MKPKYEIGQRVMVRSSFTKIDNAVITERHTLSKGEVVHSRAAGKEATVKLDTWAYELDCSPDAVESVTVRGLCYLEKYIYPHHDGGEDFNTIMDSLKSPKGERA